MTHFQRVPPDGVSASHIAAGQGSAVRNKWDLLKAVEGARAGLGLKGTTIALLRAMLSFVRSDQIDDRSDAHHICFASNAALAERTHVSIQTVERHVAKLVSLGLITRRASGNGKRWARRNGQGDVVLATGLSLMPLVQRHAELAQQAAEAAAARARVRHMQDRCRAAMAELRAIGGNQLQIEDIVTRAAKMLRRKQCENSLHALLSEIEQALPDTDEMRDTDTQIEGQKETNLIQSVKEEKEIEVSVSPEDMQRAFPRLCAELRFERTPEACDRRMTELAAELRLGKLWDTLRGLGHALRFMVLGYVLERIERIARPAAYVQKIYQDLDAGQGRWERLLQRPQRTVVG